MQGESVGMKYRSRTDIIAMILQAAKAGATKTHLMYGAYVTYVQIQEYVEFLQEKGLLLCEKGSQKYKLTEKGLHFLRVHDQISQLLVVPLQLLGQNPQSVITELAKDKGTV